MVDGFDGVMSHQTRLSGRFLPARVYARWTWAVRFGLLAVPLVLLLSGGLVLYLTPNRYESTAEFEYVGQRSPRVAAALLKSRNVTDLVIGQLGLRERQHLDFDTLTELITSNMDARADETTGLIELKVTHTQKDLARDLAAELPMALERYEKSVATAAIQRRIDAIKQSLNELEEEVSEKRQALRRLIEVRGTHAPDTIPQLDLDAARGAWEYAQHRAFDRQAQLADAQRELSDLGHWVAIHTQPQIAQSPVGKKFDESLGALILQGIVVGLAVALLLPYLLELAIPHRRRPPAIGGEEWTVHGEEP